MSCTRVGRSISQSTNLPYLEDLLQLQAATEKNQFPLENEDEMEGRLRNVQSQITEAKLDWVVVPSEDEHQQSEEVGESEKRLLWISGFSGSAGTALIPSSHEQDALLFVDSRYWVQAEQQVPKQGWKVVRVGATGNAGRDSVVSGWVDYMIEEFQDGTRVGIDPRLISVTLARTIQDRLSEFASSSGLIATSDNLIDKVRGPPERSLGPINPYPLSLSGETTTSKLKRIRQTLSKRASGSSSRSYKPEWIYLLPTLPAIAWLLNYRCPSDVPFCPVAYAYLLLTKTRCVIFVDGRKVGDELRDKLEIDKVELRPYGVEEVGKVLQEELSKLKAADEKSHIKVWAPRECSWALASTTQSTQVNIIPCPVDVAKAIKNSMEQQGMRNAHLRDGRATVRWMSWLEGKIVKDGRPVGEWAAGQALNRFRAQEEYSAGLAFDNVSASGPNAASPHYIPQRGTDRIIDPDTTYVIDSGGQYLDGTIDTTRTLYLGKSPSDEIKRAYTRVLQGHLSVSTHNIPKNMPSDHLNMLARGPLYRDGLNFGHGIGHGVGTYLAVHEYPVSFPHAFSYEPGHITTVEPGYYKEGEFGIRIESTLLCKTVDTLSGTKDQWLNWERLTQVPIQTKMVDWKLMTKEMIKCLNEHNFSVEAALLPLLQDDRDKETRDWLKVNCKPKKIWPWT
ncbi:cytoplasmic protein [Tremella mesenterica]|uniref:Cytoplasmic protein n=1 Tax=Tremella mesenterica TaxID=5217 RepID=A0A4Q1BVT5_TREME|nr:cytoplasmic protein [Tremella mesenterica]